MINKKFNPAKLEKLNDPQRLVDIPLELILDRLHASTGGVIVDVGAGTGFFSRAFAERCKPLNLYACDVSDTMISWMQDNVVSDYPEIVPTKSDENALPIEDGIADLAFMINLHHELEDPSRMLAEIFRILKSDGEVFVVDWKKAPMPDGPPVAIRCHSKDVRDQLMRTGFGDVSVFEDLPKHFLVTGHKIDAAS